MKERILQKYNNGNPKSVHIEHSNGKVSMISYFTDGNIESQLELSPQYDKEQPNIKLGYNITRRTSYHNNGALKELDDCTPNGKRKTFYESGKPESIGQYDEEGFETGEWHRCYENGKLESSTNYHKGIEFGFKQAYNTRGQLISKSFYQFGEKNGVDIQYHSNGRIKSKSMYVDDYIDGEQLIFNNKGRLEQRGYYSYGERRGPFAKYKDGIHISKLNCYENELKVYEYTNVHERSAIMKIFQCFQDKMDSALHNGKSFIEMCEDKINEVAINLKEGLREGKRKWEEAPNLIENTKRTIVRNALTWVGDKFNRALAKGLDANQPVTRRHAEDLGIDESNNRTREPSRQVDRQKNMAAGFEI